MLREMSRLNFLNDVSWDMKKYASFLTDTLNKLGWSEEGLFAGTHQASIDKEDGGTQETLGKAQDRLLEPDGDNTYDEHLLKEYNDLMASLQLPTKVEKEKTWLEIMAAERDAKRRRISYKNKIHTKHKSYNEVLREVIEQQMEALGGWMSSDHNNADETNETVSATSSTEPNMIEVRPPLGNPHLAWKTLKPEDFIIRYYSPRDDHTKQNKKIEEKSKNEEHSDRNRKRHKDDESVKHKKRRRSSTPIRRRSKDRRSDTDSYRKAEKHPKPKDLLTKVSKRRTQKDSHKHKSNSTEKSSSSKKKHSSSKRSHKERKR